MACCWDYRSSTAKVIDGFSRLITQGDVRRLGVDLKDEMIDGNKALKTFKDCIDRLCLEPRMAIALKGKGGSLYIRNAFDKSMPPEFTDYDGESLLHLVVEEARALRSDVVVVNPFRLKKKEPPETKKVAAKKVSANSGLVRYNASGEAEGQKVLTLQRHGFAVGVGVQRVTGDDNEGETFTIHAIDPDGAVHLKRSDPKAKLLRSSFEIFMQKYKLHEVIEVKWKPPKPHILGGGLRNFPRNRENGCCHVRAVRTT